METTDVRQQQGRTKAQPLEKMQAIVGSEFIPEPTTRIKVLDLLLNDKIYPTLTSNYISKRLGIGQNLAYYFLTDFIRNGIVDVPLTEKRGNKTVNFYQPTQTGFHLGFVIQPNKAFEAREFETRSSLESYLRHESDWSQLDETWKTTSILLNPKRRTIYHELLNRGSATNRDLSKATGISPELSFFHCSRLVSADLVEVQATIGNSGSYIYGPITPGLSAGFSLASGMEPKAYGFAPPAARVA